MPNFYAKDILDKGAFCLSKTEDKFFKPAMKALGLCKSMDDYGFRLDADGNPLVEDCQKNNFGIYYTSPESLTLFRAFYDNE
mmetsp:Transcript_12969/g.20090  ORF Transcript_12969/g.20090 Transcript_12969/m.20090 type:complete len:82 (+) Transcript_12969:398-643(+)